ncbi:Presilphiperfolan-8-beta-ol synthase [Apiospora phragmitis]|uniref:Presilphiperfolan-8-beta-ol synthase n=1 Tax=Apiospora phragmitis TaxID=2905665 RepID=A0ABR1WTH4_9PEZI
MEVVIPDLFTSILSVDSIQNPNYEEVKKEADSWIATMLSILAITLGYDREAAGQNSRADFTGLATLGEQSPPLCESTQRGCLLRKIMRWGAQAFPWDDQFDDGHLKDDVFQAAKNIVQTVSILDDSHPLISQDTNPMAHVFKFSAAALSIDDYLEFWTIGVMPCTALVEYALGIDLPDHVINHQSLEECREVAVDLVLLDNDILSYKKDMVLIDWPHHYCRVTSPVICYSQVLTSSRVSSEARAHVGYMLSALVQRSGDDAQLGLRPRPAGAGIPRWAQEYRSWQFAVEVGISISPYFTRIGFSHGMCSFWTRRYFDKEEGRRLRETRVLGVPTELGTLRPSER